MNLKLMGNVQMGCAGGPDIVLANRKAAALLAYLAVDASQAHSREVLSALLWPALPEKDARNNLRVVWSHLQSQLGQAGLPEPALLSSRLDLQFNARGNIQVDVIEFDQLLRQCEAHAGHHTKRSLCPECHPRLLRAADLYRGEFLAGLVLDDCETFDEWQFMQRERLHLQAIDALTDIADFYEHAGQYDLAERFARRQLALDPLREQAHRQVMRALAQQGRRTEALAQFETCTRVLADTLGLEPDGETRALHGRIKSSATPAALPATGPDWVLRLPQLTTPFIGREDELNAIEARLFDGAYRLFTIVGAGGMGKTRLALQLAHHLGNRFAGGVCYVPLTPLQDASEIPVAVWRALGAQNERDDAMPATGASLWQQMLAALRHQHLLIIFDNFEHLLHAGRENPPAAVSHVLALLQHAPNVSIIVTSREQLNVQAEDVFQLSGLSWPKARSPAFIDPVAAGHFAAVRLFCERAHRANKLFKLQSDNVNAVLRVCQHIQGNPLGIELAATWLASMTCAELADALADSFDLLETTMQDVPAHHRSMRAVINQSWQMLAPAERMLLSRLSIFRDGFTPEAVKTIAEATPLTLIRLRRTSLLQMDGGGRYDLHELLRQFALEKLREHGDDAPANAPFGEDELRQRHSVYYLKWIASHEAALKGRQPRLALNSIRTELDNVREAWRWAVSHRRMAQTTAVLAGSVESLWCFYSLSGLYVEGEQAFAAVLREAGADDDSLSLQMHSSLASSEMVLRQGKLNEAARHARTALQLSQQLCDQRSEARSQLLLGWALRETGSLHDARKMLEQAQRSAQQAHDLGLEGDALRRLGNLLNDLGLHAQSDAVLQQAHRIEQALGNAVQEQTVLLNLGICQLLAGDLALARTYLEEAMRLMPQTGARATEARIENGLGFLEARLGQFERARAHHERALKIAQETGELVQESSALHNLCTVTRKNGQLDEAEWFGREALRTAVDCASSDHEMYAWLHLGYVWLAKGDLAHAQPAFARARDLADEMARTTMVIEATAGLAAVAHAQGKHAEALAHAEQAMAHTQQHGFADFDEPQEVQRVIDEVRAAERAHLINAQSSI
jgi:predicted ATPase/DNA-binding SARP family transcriptional activator/Tfp pilus assembly protein PilF